jgi:putative effector of murein hydrolase
MSRVWKSIATGLGAGVGAAQGWYRCPPSADQMTHGAYSALWAALFAVIVSIVVSMFDEPDGHA